MARQWISIEEATEKYQVPATSINKWRRNSEITFSQIDGYLLLDENSLTDCLERHIRFSLSAKELNEQMAARLREKEERFFILKSLKKLTPLIRMVIMELAAMIHNDNRKELFLFLSLQGTLEEYAARTHRNPSDVQQEYKNIIHEIYTRSGFFKSYKEDLIHLKAKLKTYELKLNRLAETELIPESDSRKTAATEAGTATSFPLQKPENITALLETPIPALNLPIRAQRIIINSGMKTLRDLLQYTHTNGFEGLCQLPYLGLVSMQNVQTRLKELGILDEQNQCYLYKYLEEQESESKE